MTSKHCDNGIAMEMCIVSVRLIILGMARPDAPQELGLALSQARAVRVRSHLLGLLANSASWQDEDANEGVRGLDLHMAPKLNQINNGSMACLKSGYFCIIFPCAQVTFALLPKS